MKKNLLRNFKPLLPGNPGSVHPQHYLTLTIIISISLASYIFAKGIVHNEYTLPFILIGVFFLIYLFNNIRLNIYLLFLFLFSLDYLNFLLGLLPRQFTWFPESLSIVLMSYILLQIIKFKSLPDHKAYRFFAVYLCILFTGVLVNWIKPTVFLTGINNHLKFVPFFFIPFFKKFNESEIRKVIKLLFFLTFLQFPVTVIQFLTKDTRSGDLVGGSIGANTSGILSIFLSIMIVLWNTRFFKRKLSFFQYVLGLLALTVPMSLNETKVSAILIPLAFLISTVALPEAKRYKKKMFIGCIMLLVVFFGYRFAYNTFYASDYTPRGIDNYILNPQFSFEYLSGNPEGRMSRLASISFAFNQISRNPIHLLFGVGIGNASESFFRATSGEYHRIFGELVIMQTSYAFLLWEVGVLGSILFLFILIYLAIFAYKKRNVDGPYHEVFTMVFSMVVIFLPMMAYTNVFRDDLFLYLFWFVAGLMINFTRKDVSPKTRVIE
jgi:hypothetical protein